MARIPDVGSLGERDIPQSSGMRIRAQPVEVKGYADALGKAGEAVTAYANEEQAKVDKFNYLKAKVELDKKQNEAILAMEQEPDYRKHEKIYEAIVGPIKGALMPTLKKEYQEAFGLEYDSAYSDGMTKLKINSQRKFFEEKAKQAEEIVNYTIDKIVNTSDPEESVRLQIQLGDTIRSIPGVSGEAVNGLMRKAGKEIAKRKASIATIDVVNDQLSKFKEDGTIEKDGTIFDNLPNDERIKLFKSRERAILDEEKINDKKLILASEASTKTKLENELKLTDSLADESIPYEQKLKVVNEMDLKGEIRPEYASEYRRYLTSKKELDSISNSDVISDIVTRIYDLNSISDIKPNDYLLGIRDIKKEIYSKGADGVLSSNDIKTLENQIKTLTSNKVSEATNSIAFSFGESRKRIEEQLPPSLRGKAIRDLFYDTISKTEGLTNREEIKAVYSFATTKILSEINEKRRKDALKIKDEGIQSFATEAEAEKFLLSKGAEDGTVVIINGKKVKYRKK